MATRDRPRGLRWIALLALGALILGIVGALAVLSVHDTFTRDAGADADADAASDDPEPETAIIRLERERDRLRAGLRARDDLMESYGAALNQILDHLRSIGDAEDEVIRVRRAADPELGLVREDYRSEIRQRMAEIERRLDASRRLETELHALLDEVAPGSGRSEQIGATLDALRRILERKERRIAELEDEVAELLRDRVELEETLAAEREQLERQAERIDELEHDAAGYLLAADELRLEALRWQGVLRQRKGVLELTPGALAEKRLERHGFVRIAPESRLLPLPSRRHAVEVRSIHARYADLYRLDATAPGIMALHLEQPEAFWQLSRFLIVELR